MKLPARAAQFVWLLCLALSVWLLATHTRINTDLTLLLPRDAGPAEQLIVQQLREGVASRLILIALEDAPEAKLAETSKTMAALLRESALFNYVGNGERALSPEARELLFSYRYLLSPNVTPERFTSTGLRAALKTRLAELASAIGMIGRAMLPGDPTGELFRISETWAGQTAQLVKRDVWFSEDGQRALLVVESKAAGFDLDGQEQALRTIKRIFSEAGGNNSANILLSGPGVFGVEARDKIQSDITRLSTLDIVFLIALLGLIYRSGRLILLIMTPLLSGALIAVVTVGLVFGSIHGVTLAFGTTLIGVANDYPIHLFTHMAPRKSLKETLKRIWPTLRLGVLATIAGFSSMLFSGFEGLAQLGLFAIVGLLGAAIVTRWVLPAFVPVGFDLPKWPRFGPWALATLGRAQRLRLAPVLLMCLAIAYLALTQRPLWNDDPANLSPVSNETKATDASLRGELGAPELSKLMVIFADSQEQALRRSEALATELRILSERGAISGFDMAALYLPSLETQNLRRAALPDATTLERRLDQAMQDLPFKADVFAPFVRDVQAAKNQTPLDMHSFDGTPLSLKLGSLLFQRDRQWVALVPLNGVADPAQLSAMLTDIDLRDTLYLDLKAESQSLMTTYRNEALVLCAWGALAITLLLAFGLRSWSAVARVLMPMLAALSVVCALIVAIGQGLTLFHLVSLLLVVGISIDYALFFNHGARDEQEKVRTLLSLLTCSLMTLVAFGVLIISHTIVLSAIGTTVALGALFAFVFSAMLAQRQTIPV